MPKSSKSKSKKSGEKGPKGWTTPEQYDWLQAQIPTYLSEKADGTRPSSCSGLNFLMAGLSAGQRNLMTLLTPKNWYGLYVIQSRAKADYLPIIAAQAMVQQPYTRHGHC
jgi:hypothetical protein